MPVSEEHERTSGTLHLHVQFNWPFIYEDLMVFWQLQIKFEWLIYHSFCLVIFMNLIFLANINLFIIG